MTKKYSISFLIPILKGGGAERNVINLISHLNKDVYDISIVTGNLGGNLEGDIGKDIKIVNLQTAHFLDLFFKLTAYLRKEKPDILFSALPHINTISMMAKTVSFSPTKVILTEHTTFSLISKTARTFAKRFIAGHILPVFMKFFYKKADAIVCVSFGVAEDLYRVVGRLPIISVIYNPVTDEKIYELAKELLGQDQPLFDGPFKTIIAVGRLVKAKDYPTLLRAFALVLNTIDANLVILGEGPEEDFLKDFAQKLQVASKVTFLGFKNNPYKYMANADAFVLSSIREGFGNVIVEAMACGVVVVSTNCKSGPSEIIQNEVNGLLVPPENQSLLTNAIVKVLTNNELSEKLIEAGKVRAEYFSIEKSVKKYEEVFMGIINK